MIGDIANSIWQINEQLENQTHWDSSYFVKVRAAGEAHYLEGADDERFPMLPQRLVADVRKVTEGKGIIALDNGVYKIWFARNYKAHSPNTVLLDNNLGIHLIDVPVDYSENDRILNHDIQERSLLI